MRTAQSDFLSILTGRPAPHTAAECCARHVWASSTQTVHVTMGNVFSSMRAVVNTRTLPVAAVCLVLWLARQRTQAAEAARRAKRSAASKAVRQRYTLSVVAWNRTLTGGFCRLTEAPLRLWVRRWWLPRSGGQRASTRTLWLSSLACSRAAAAGANGQTLRLLQVCLQCGRRRVVV